MNLWQFYGHETCIFYVSYSANKIPSEENNKGRRWYQMHNKFAELSPEDIKIITEAQSKLSDTADRSIALVAYEV